MLEDTLQSYTELFLYREINIFMLFPLRGTLIFGQDLETQ